MVDREDENEGGSSPDTVIARAEFEEVRRRRQKSTSASDSRFSLDSRGLEVQAGASAGVLEEKKKKRFGGLKNTFRRDSGFFKKKDKSVDSKNSGDVEAYEDSSKETTRRTSAPPEKRSSPPPAPSPSPPVTRMMKKKKSGSLVRKLSLSKFRLGSSDQETRQTPEGGDSSRSQSQSSQDSPGYPESPVKSSKKAGHVSRADEDRVKGREKRPPVATPTSERGNPGTWGQDREEGVPDGNQRRADDAKPRHKLEKTVSTVTVVQRKSPSVTIRTSFPQDRTLTPVKEPRPDPSGSQAVSTLPYALSKWSDHSVDIRGASKKLKLAVKAGSESSLRTPPVTPPVELRRKLSLLEEKRAIFQRKFFASSEGIPSLENSRDTVVGIKGSSPEDKSEDDPLPDNFGSRRPSKHISVRTFDIYSTVDGDFDEESEDYLEGIEDQEDQEEPVSMALAGETSAEASRTLSVESGSTHNSAPSAGVGEKREHLYKILVIGELGAGKTSIIKRYVHQFFSQHYRATIGVDFALKVLNWDPHTIIRLQLWDIAGQERFGNMTRVYYKEAVGAFIVFDVTRSATLEAVVKWKQDLDSKVQLPDGSPIPCVLLANKCDQQKEGLVNSPGKMDDYCKEKGFAGWFETSAKENINIEEAARFLVNKILQNDQLMKGNGAQDQVDGERFALNQSPTSSKKSCSC
ncbi:ras-related protein Rab-44 isoform X1 [Fopius arisanus]|uniref:Ras-related protein Rab-44 isoform X1 n=1 Tax=Fopius arisanus TaxID=64838 RepID=A0A9R1TL74_9HYME|nr:PREDICTED: ras-related protein Rab-44 isoform X1 [Fopius arisanus]XP_011311317.1 PREDICTED: ras-related protein Rab-44 isoform X1 [Fopius arisanus]